jgi:hypothetical protein
MVPWRITSIIVSVKGEITALRKQKKRGKEQIIKSIRIKNNSLIRTKGHGGDT